MIDEPGAAWMPVPPANVFPSYWGNTPRWIVIHKTASAGTAQEIATFFAHDPAKASSHYIVGTDGLIVQCVHEADGAGANCCAEPGYASFLPGHLNLNLVTISIEHCDPASDNSTPLTDAQKTASFKLIKDICERHSIPMRRGDANGGIIGHCDIAPISRAHCPGNYPWNELFTFLDNGGNMLPSNWHLSPDGQTLYCKNIDQNKPDVPVQFGFKDFVLPLLQSGAWLNEDVFLGPQEYKEQLEYSDPDLGDGDQIISLFGRMLCFPHNPKGAVAHLKGQVVLEYSGVELNRWKDQFLKLLALYQADEAKLKEQPSGNSPDLVQRLSLISGLVQQAGPILQQISTAATVK